MINDKFGSKQVDFSVININIWRGGTDAFQGSDSKDTVGPEIALAKIASYVATNLGSLDGILGLQEIYTEVDFCESAEDGIIDGEINEANFIADMIERDWQAVTGITRNANIGKRANAILTNLNVEKQQVWNFAFDQNIVRDYGRFPRGAVAAKLKLPGESTFPRKLWVVCTHFDGGSHEGLADPPGVVAIRQLFQALGRIKTFDPDFPVILMGDFNIKKSLGQPYAALQHLMMQGVSGFQEVCSHLRMYLYLYDPNKRLEIVSADDRNDPTGRTFESVTFTDHAVLKADFRWREPLKNAPIDV
ncbi:MAG: hypothetical protein KDE28_13955 [Anaerolineales bacterium]|nr:hypothetical protein [Anaerolineales bacterium]